MTGGGDMVLIGGLALNLLATIGAYVKLRVEIEHRLTALETHVLLSIKRDRPGGEQ